MYESKRISIPRMLAYKSKTARMIVYEEPCCYDLQQFMIDQRFQGQGYGAEALRQILSLLEEERRFDCVEVCVKSTDTPALRLYEKTGFVDTGYIDPDLPEFVNLMYYFKV